MLVAPGAYPSDAGPEVAPPGDFTEVPSPVCDGSERTAPLGGELARIDLDALKARFPANTDGFDGREPGSGEQTASGRPNTEPTAFVVKVVATAGGETGQDRRQAYLHRDRDLLPGFPRQLDGDGEASPALADLDGDDRSELIVANSDGVVHALRPDGSDAPGFPVRTDELPMQAGRAFGTGGVRHAHGAIVASPAVGDLDRDGVPEVVAADLEGKATCGARTARASAPCARTRTTRAARSSRSPTSATATSTAPSSASSARPCSRTSTATDGRRSSRRRWTATSTRGTPGARRCRASPCSSSTATRSTWDPATGGFRPGWPRPVNDLQFLTGPSVADIDPASPGEEVVSGTASDDLQGFTGAGTNVSRAWPKLTGDWTVANPAIGAFGTRETDPGARKAVNALTRSGRILAYRTSGPACASASWPRFHHDNANSGDARRDAVAPGRPEAVQLTARRLAFTAPGDDLLCGRAARYEVRTADAPITPATFAEAQPVDAVGTPGPAGGVDTLELRGRLGRYLAVRAVDEQGNAGRPAALAR